jgi:hypothetical protein
LTKMVTYHGNAGPSSKSSNTSSSTKSSSSSSVSYKPAGPVSYISQGPKPAGPVSYISQGPKKGGGGGGKDETELTFSTLTSEQKIKYQAGKEIPIVKLSTQKEAERWAGGEGQQKITLRYEVPSNLRFASSQGTYPIASKASSDFKTQTGTIYQRDEYIPAWQSPETTKRNIPVKFGTILESPAYSSDLVTRQELFYPEQQATITLTQERKPLTKIEKLNLQYGMPEAKARKYATAGAVVSESFLFGPLQKDTGIRARRREEWTGFWIEPLERPVSSGITFGTAVAIGAVTGGIGGAVAGTALAPFATGAGIAMGGLYAGAKGYEYYISPTPEAKGRVAFRTGLEMGGFILGASALSYGLKAPKVSKEFNLQETAIYPEGESIIAESAGKGALKYGRKTFAITQKTTLRAKPSEEQYRLDLTGTGELFSKKGKVLVSDIQAGGYGKQRGKQFKYLMSEITANYPITKEVFGKPTITKDIMYGEVFRIPRKVPTYTSRAFTFVEKGIKAESVGTSIEVGKINDITLMEGFNLAKIYTEPKPIEKFPVFARELPKQESFKIFPSGKKAQAQLLSIQKQKEMFGSITEQQTNVLLESRMKEILQTKQFKTSTRIEGAKLGIRTGVGILAMEKQRESSLIRPTTSVFERSLLRINPISAFSISRTKERVRIKELVGIKETVGVKELLKYPSLTTTTQTFETGSMIQEFPLIIKPIKPFGFPVLPLPLFKSPKSIKAYKGRQPKKYMPSFTAVVFNIRAKKQPRLITGMEIRPIII